MKISHKSAIALTVALLELSLLPILLDVAGAAVGDVALLFYAFLVAAVVSTSIAFFYDREGLISLFSSKRNLAIIGTAGLANNAIAQILLAVGTLGTNPSIAGIMFRGWVLIAALLMPFVLKTKVTKMQLGAIALGMIGLYIVVSHGTLFSINQAQLPYMLILLGSAFSSATAILMMRKYSVSTIASVSVFNIVSVVFLGAVALAFGINLSISATPQIIAIILFLGAVNYGVITTLYYYAMKTLNPVLVGNATLVVPFLTILLSAVLVGTPIQAYYFYATVLIIAAVLAQQKLSHRAPEHISAKQALSCLTVFDVTSAFVNNEKIIRGMKAEDKVLAIKLAAQNFDIDGCKEIFNSYGCIAFTDSMPFVETKREEMEFVNEIVGKEQGEIVLMGMGDAKHIEIALDHFTKGQKTSNKF